MTKKTGRRTFLASMAAMPAMTADPALVSLEARAQTPASRGDAVHSSYDPWVEVHTANLRHNISVIARRAGGRPIMAVIKNNAYGLGIVNAGRILDALAMSILFSF